MKSILFKILFVGRKFLVVSPLTICMFASNLANCQTANTNLNNSSPPSPNASSEVGDVGKSSVNLYTGRINYSAKINDFSTSKVNISVGVNFCSSGIKVQDVDGPVGIGWRLTAGGVISRYIHSAPDESTNGYCGPNRIGGKNYSYYNNANMTWVTNVTNNDNTKTTWDSEPDQFYFSFLNFSGNFTLDPDGNPVLQSSYGLKIVYSPFNRTNGRMAGGNEDWIIMDMAGNQYFFGDGAVENTTSTQHGQLTKNTFTYSYLSSWYLSKIVTTDNQVINFQYQSFPQQSYTNHMNVELRGFNPDNSPLQSFYNENNDITISSPLYLSKITSPTVELDFIYNANSPYLIEVDAKQNGVLEYKYQLNYIAYNYPTYTRELLSNISQLSISTGHSIKMYQFGYANLVLPDRSSSQIDYWGYYNSNTAISVIYGYGGCDKTPDPVKTTAFMLTSVTNVYGGVTSFTYEQNDCNNGPTTLIGGLRIKSVSTLVNGVNTNKVLYSYTLPQSNTSSGQVFNIEANGYACGEFFFPNNYNFSQSIIGMADFAGTEVGYSWVTVTQADGGSVRTHFTNFTDYPDVGQDYLYDNVDGGETFSQNPTTDTYTLYYPKSSFSFARGKVLSEEYIDLYGNTVKKETNVYSLSTPQNDVIWLKIYPYEAPILVYTGNAASFYSIRKADFVTQDLLLTSKTDTTNFYSNLSFPGSVATNENYTYRTYAGNNFLASKTTLLSNGNTEKTTYRYPFDVLTSIPTSATTSQPFLYMVLNNMIGQPVETVTSVINGGSGTEVILGVGLTQYSATAYGTIKPSSAYRVKTSQTLLKSNYVSFSVTPSGTTESDTVDPNLEQTELFTQYDSFGNLIESNNPYTTNGQTSFLWGYGGDYMIAKAQNAKSTEFYYDSFENSTLGNVISSTSAHTGTHYYSASTYTVGWAKPDTKTYYISYWYLSGTIWKYSVASYAGNTTTLTGGSGYDDICIFPSDALVTANTYEPLVGMTSSESSNGITTTYQFDDYKRLINVLDQNGNIVKNYNYYISGNNGN